MNTTTKPQPQILICTPAYNGQVHVNYLHSMLNFFKNEIHYSVMTLDNESLITRARNTLISTFWSKEQFTHLLFLDADVFLDHEGLQSMLAAKKDVIGAPVFLKGRDSEGKQTLNTDANPEISPVVQSVQRVGTAALLLSRTAVAALVNKAIEEKRTYTLNEMLQTQDVPSTHYDIFRVGVADDEYLSEDFWLCRELRSLGFEIYVDTSVYTRHHGIVAFD